MPIIKSAIERVKVNEKAQVRNASQLSTMRTTIKNLKRLKQPVPVPITWMNYSRTLFLLLIVPILKV